jgi:hypothetical protein
MTSYYNIPQEEFEAFLFPIGFQKIELVGVKELVYSRRIHSRHIPHKLALSLRVFSGIESSGESRGVGEDAIRVCLFWRKNDGQIVKASGSKRVHRVNGWKNNLKNRLDGWEQDFITCSVCGSPMVERKNGQKGNKFIGCCNYPVCRATRPILNQNRKVSTESLVSLSSIVQISELHAEQEALAIEASHY